MSSASERLNSILKTSLCLIQWSVGIVFHRTCLRYQSVLNYCQICSLSGEPFAGRSGLCEQSSQCLWLFVVNYCFSTVCRIRVKLLPSQRQEGHPHYHYSVLPHSHHNILVRHLPSIVLCSVVYVVCS